MENLQKSLEQLVAFLKVRQLELRNPEGVRVFKLALTWVAAVLVLALVTRLFVFVVIGAVVLLVLKFKFTLTREATSRYDTPEKPS